MFLRLKLYAVGVAAFVLALLGIYWTGKRDGAAAVKADHMANRLEDTKRAKEIDDELDSLSDPHFVDRAGEWVRKDNGQ